MISREAGARVYREGAEEFPVRVAEYARALIVCHDERDLRTMQEALAAAGVG